MTLRAKPVVRGPGRSGWNSDDRRTALLNLGFVVVIVASLLILVGYAGFSWYDDHFGAAATVNGTTITKDQLRTRYAIESFRIDYTESRIRTLQAAGRLSEASATSQLQYLEQRKNSLASVALERLIDTTLQASLAEEEGVAVTDTEIDAQLQVEATIDEQRHTWSIEVTPAADPATGKPGDAEKAAAKAKAEAAVSELRSGKPWGDVAKTVSDAASAAQDGDLGWLPEDSTYDAPFMAAVFAATVDEPTDVIEGDDGVYRIGRVTEIAPTTVDETYQARLDEATIKMTDYRAAIRGDLVRDALDKKIVADLSKPSKQRHAAQIRLATATPVPDGIKVRHILVSPKDDPGGAGALPADDPAWKAAEDEAKAIYAEVTADPTKFDRLAREKSDEGSAKSTGGKLPYFDASSAIDPAFATAILAPGLKPGDIIAPFKSAFGWHVVQVMRPYGNGEEAWLKGIREQLLAGGDFAQVARDQGEGAEAADGGDIGWLALGQLSALKEAQIFLTSVGSISDVVTLPDDGSYLWKVLAEETREPTKEQIAIFKDSGFTNWYAAKKAAATITRNTGTPSATQ